MRTPLTRRSALALVLAAACAAPAAAQIRGRETPQSFDAPARQAQAALTQAGGRELTGAARAAALARANAALNDIRLLQGRFIQIAAGNTTTGAFHMQRPGRLRFAYDPPASMLIVADGSVVAVQDTALRSVNRAPLRSTPLFFVLKSDIDLERDARVTRVAQQGDTLFVTVRDRTGAADGAITLALVGPNLELRSWDVTDATGARTRLALTDVSRPASIDQRLFRSPLPPATGPRRRR